VRLTASLAAGAALLLTVGEPAAAQVRSALTLGTGLEPATATSSAGAWAFRPALRLGGELAGGTVDGHLAGLLDGGWTGEVRATGHVRFDLDRPFFLTTSVAGEVGRLADAMSVTRVGTAARLDAEVGSWGGWLRVSTEQANGIDHATPVVGLGAGSSVNLGTLRLSVSSSANRYLDRAFTSTPVGDSVVVLMRESRPRTYLQGELAADWAHRLLRVQVAVGARFAQTEGADNTWARATAEVPLDRRLSVVGAFGKHPGVPEQGLDGRHFARAGLRVRLLGGGDAAAGARVVVPDGTLVTEPAGSAHLIRVVARDAGVVEITGDLTDWSPLLLDRSEDGVWETTLPLQPGFYRVAIRIDGGAWTAPAGLPSVPDEFGGRVGALVVN